MKFSGFQKTKDVVYGDGTRATFLFDITTEKFGTEPIALIKKERIEDLNIKSGQKKESVGLFGSDIRISCSSEQP